MVKLSDYELGWLVAILEGEGHFSIRNRTQRVDINMTDEDTMNTVAILFGKLTGKTHVLATVPNDRENCKEAWRIHLSGESARTIMRTVVPYMHKRRRGRIWQCLNGYVEPKQKTLKELGIDILQLVKANERTNG